MSLTSDFLKAMNAEEEEEKQKKKKKKQQQIETKQAGGDDLTRSFLTAMDNDEIVPDEEDDIAPTVGTLSRGSFAGERTSAGGGRKKDERTWFQKGALEDGASAKNVGKTILGTVADVAEGIVTGIVGMGEQVVDLAAFLAPYAAKGQYYANGGAYQTLQEQQLFEETNEQGREFLHGFVKKDLYDEEAVAKKLLANVAGAAYMNNISQSGGFATEEDWELYQQMQDSSRKYIDTEMESDSVLGERSDALTESLGPLLVTKAVAPVVPWQVVTGITSAGGEVESALNEGATSEEAGVSAAVTAGADILSEYLMGGMFGETGLDDALIKRYSRTISNKLLRNTAAVTTKGLGEGLEEEFSLAISRFGKWLTYQDEKTLKEMFLSEDALEEAGDAFWGGFVLGGGNSAVDSVKSATKGVDFASGLTANEQKVVDKVYQDLVAEQEKNGKLTQKQKSDLYDQVLSDMEKGYLSTDTIEEVLGGESYKTYKDTVDSEDAIAREYEELGKKQNATLAEQTRYNELHEQMKNKDDTKRNELKSKLSGEVMSLVQNDRLAESYNERGRRGQAFEADLTQYDTKQQETIKKAIESGILNNTNRTHEFVGLIAKITADKGVLFDFTNNAKLKESGFAVDGKTVNGYVTKDGVTLNIDSAKSLNSVVGHEITHVLEGTELYDALSQTVIEYAKSKGDYQGRYDALAELYKDVEDANIDAELTADLVGDYLFSDADFVRSLSTNHRNVFQKIYDEIKYLCKVATAGSKEARELEKVKRAFEDAYRGEGKAKAGTQYSLDMVDAVQPKSDKWSRTHTTEEAMARFPNMWNVAAEESEVRNPTQITSTVNSYRKIYNALQSEGFNGTILDASSGLGYGTRAGIEEYGFNVEDIEPYPDKDYKPKYQDYSSLNKKYDVIISNAVLNVLPQDQRDALAVKMGELLNDGGRLFVNVRGKDVETLAKTGKNIHLGNMEWIETVKGSYQKGFTKPELVAYLQDALGDGFTVKPTNMFGAVSAVVTKDGGVKYSLSDSDGKQLTTEQQEYFKDSKMRDENGNLKVMYHGTEYGGFHTFDAGRSDDGTSLFFVDSPEVAASYSGSNEEYTAQTLRTAEDFNRFFAETGADGFEVVERNGKFELYQDGDREFVCDTAKELYDEYCDWAGVGEGEVNYKVYLNLTNPLEVDAEGNRWNALPGISDKAKYDYIKIVEVGDAPGQVTIEYTMNGDTAPVTETVDLYKKFPDGLADALSDMAPGESVDDVYANPATTREYALYAKEQGYDGVIFKNIYDIGAYGGSGATEATVAIAFSSDQIKSVANENPTGDPDIRYSLSPAVQKRFRNSKVVDENGNLKVVYHGTATGEFSIFDKSKGSVEGDFGSGFYFTDNEADVSEHYEGGGPDFENKVIRRAEQIMNEDDTDWDEAEERARNELYKGSHKFEVYLNIENPAIVGKTMLLDGESYMEQYSEDDYDDYDDYIGDVEQLVADDIENVVWEVERNCDVYSTDGISEILWDACANGGIGIEELKHRLNELYIEDNNGNFAANEVARQIIESLGFDGIIDPTVSGKWNMNIEKGTTHYIVFKPNQIKAITNQNPTDDPDIHRSLSNEGETPTHRTSFDVFGSDIKKQYAPVAEDVAVAENATTTEELFPEDAPMPEDEATAHDRLASITDADMPPEVEAPIYANDPEIVDSPFEDRDWYEVGRNRSEKAYMYENPEVKPFFQEEAAIMLAEWQNTERAERWYIEGDFDGYGSESYYRFGGQKRNTSESIAEMRDNWNFSYDDIKKGLEAIIEDNGAENIAAAKRIEFMLNDRLMKGYKDFFTGERVPPNQDYLNLLYEKQINEYSEESFERLLESGDAYAPVEDIAPVVETAPVQTADRVAEPYEAIRPKRAKEPSMARATPEEQQTAKVLTEEPQTTKKNFSLWNWAKNNLIDKGSVFETLSLKTGNRELQARWSSIRRAESAGQRFIKLNLKPIVEKVEASGKTQEFFDYLHHQLNTDRMTLAERYEGMENKAVFGDHISAVMSKAEAGRLEKANPEFKQWAEEIYSFNNALRQKMVDGGVISQEVADLWQEMYPHFVPIRRAGHDGAAVNVPLDTGRTGVNAPIKKATGGNSTILPLFNTMADRTLQTFKAVAKNRFGTELMHTLDSAIDKADVSVDEAIDSVESEELLQEGKDGHNPTFTVFENGEKVTFEITEEMYDSIKPKSGIMAYTNKAANFANNLRRGLITEYNPTFWFKNPTKDLQGVITNSQHPVRTYASIPKAIMQMAQNGNYYQEYLDNGGEQDTEFEADTKTFKGNTKLDAIKKWTGLGAISKANDFIEKVPRMAEYIASREMGRSIDVAMLDAARVTTDFSAGGDIVKLMNRNGFTFLNASVQGTAQVVRNIREAKYEGAKGWAKLAGKTIVAGLPAVLLNAALWDDDEDYADLSDYVKQNYYIVAKLDDGKFVRIPKGRTESVIQEAFQQMSNLITGDDEVDFEAFGELVVSNLLPNNPLKNNILSPVFDVLNNETWYGEDLVPTRLADLPAAEQYDESTDSLSRWLGEKTNISPYKWNYLLDQYSGGVGDIFLPMGTPEAESGDDTVLGNFIAPIKDMFVTDSVMNNQNVSDFYDTKEELSANAKMSGATDEDTLMSKYMNSINAELSKLYGTKREIQNSDLSDSEKYERVREIQSQIVELTKQSLDAYDDISYREDDIAVVGGKYFKQNEDGEWSKMSDDAVTKYEVTSAAGNEDIATDGSVYYQKGEDGEWRKMSDDQVAKYKATSESDSTYATDGESHWRFYDNDEGGEWRKLSDEQVEKQNTYTRALNVSAEDYWQYYETIGNFDAKDENGNSVSGLKKERVYNYIFNELDIDYGAKCILYRSQYESKDDIAKYNQDIVDYLNSREDVTYEEMVAILTDLGFTVEGSNIYW